MGLTDVLHAPAFLAHPASGRRVFQTRGGLLAVRRLAHGRYGRPRFLACFRDSTATAALAAIGTRLWLTGALHEDGLADFCDGFGGGTTRERTLAIMKDSHIGTYGVLGLVFYIGLLISLISALPLYVAPAIIFTADVYAKACSSFIILQLPYARTAEQAKAGVVSSVWNKQAAAGHIFRCLLALVPCVMWLLSGPTAFPLWAFLVPPVTELLLTGWMKRRLQGYTGDCCGALVLLCELSFYLSIVILYHFI